MKKGRNTIKKCKKLRETIKEEKGRKWAKKFLQVKKKMIKVKIIQVQNLRKMEKNQIRKNNKKKRMKNNNNKNKIKKVRRKAQPPKTMKTTIWLMI